MHIASAGIIISGNVPATSIPPTQLHQQHKPASNYNRLRIPLQDFELFILLQLRLAQRGDVDLRGHLSKFNPDATTLGIFSQDWELRYFVLSGELATLRTVYSFVNP